MGRSEKYGVGVDYWNCHLSLNQAWWAWSDIEWKAINYSRNYSITFGNPFHFTRHHIPPIYRLRSKSSRDSIESSENSEWNVAPFENTQIYSVKLLLLLFKPFELLLILLPAVELLWLALPFIWAGLTAPCDTLVGGLRRVLMRCWSVVSKPLKTSWFGIFFANNRRFTESSYVNRATMFCKRKPWQYSMSFDALYTCARASNVTNETRGNNWIHLRVDVHCNDVVNVDDFGASGFGVAQQTFQLEETRGRHQLEHVTGRDVQVVASTAVQILHHELKSRIHWCVFGPINYLRPLREL